MDLTTETRLTAEDDDGSASSTITMIWIVLAATLCVGILCLVLVGWALRRTLLAGDRRRVDEQKRLAAAAERRAVAAERKAHHAVAYYATPSSRGSTRVVRVDPTRPHPPLHSPHPPACRLPPPGLLQVLPAAERDAIQLHGLHGPGAQEHRMTQPRASPWLVEEPRAPQEGIPHRPSRRAPPELKADKPAPVPPPGFMTRDQFRHFVSHNAPTVLATSMSKAPPRVLPPMAQSPTRFVGPSEPRMLVHAHEPRWGYRPAPLLPPIASTPGGTAQPDGAHDAAAVAFDRATLFFQHARAHFEQEGADQGRRRAESPERSEGE